MNEQDFPGQTDSSGGWSVPEPAQFLQPESGAEPEPAAPAEPFEADSWAEAPLETAALIDWQDEPSAELEQTEDFDGRPSSGANESVENTKRLIALSDKIERFPEAPVNYVLRGEVYLSIGDLASAESDFRHAIGLAEQRDPELDWGYLNTAFLDRAVEGLRQVS